MLYSVDYRDERAERTHTTLQHLWSSQREKALLTSKLSGKENCFLHAGILFLKVNYIPQQYRDLVTLMAIASHTLRT